MQRLKRLLKDQYFWYSSISIIIAALASFAPQITVSFPAPFHIEPQTVFYTAVYRLFLPIAAIFAAWKSGVRGGLIVCFILSPVVLAGVFINSQFPNILLDFTDIVVGVVLSWMVGRRGEMNEKLIKTTGELEEQSSRLKLEVIERKRVEEQYRLIADHTADIIYKMSITEERFNYVSPSVERILGYTQTEGLTVKLTEIIVPESYKKQNSELVNAIQKGINSATLRLDLIHKDGRIIPCEVHATMVFDDKGMPAEIVGVARDITERTKMEEQLLVQDRLAAIGQLTSSMAHELNNPLTSIINFSSILLKKELDEDSKQDLATIHSEAQRIANVVKNLLVLSRKQPQQKQPTNINDCIRRIVEMRSYEQRVNNITVTANYDPQIPFISANSSQLEQVFFNIIINAEFFMTEAHKAGKLDITTKRNVNNITTYFTDNGPGISQENLKNIFIPFFTTKEAGRGTGLSLSICQGIINEHGGKIMVESGENGGATFIIELPLDKE
jgi:PAS domain S-box-containing protein